ncbi:MAG: restriction endonuclease subunit S, partial [Candidatus Gastranaerophilales bacterium]|nr:restriction endonuclease subunit S [Candidatus Gastranaerophilales bacterium]
IGGEHIENTSGFLKLSNPKYIPEEFYKYSKQGKIQKHDILLCKDGALTGKVAIVRDEFNNIPAMVNEHVFILRCENTTTQKYLFNILYSLNGQNLLKANITGAAQGGLNSTNLKNIQLPLPPFDVQQKIVDEIEEVEKQNKLNEQKISELYNKIQDILEFLYNKYPMAELGKFTLPPQYGANIKAIDGNKTADYRYIRITDINDNGELLDDFKTAEKIENKYILEDGDFLFARSGATAGKTFYYTKEKCQKAIFAGYLIRFRCNSDLNSRFLDIVCKSKIYKKWAENVKGGTAQPNINAQQFAGYKIPVLPLLEQKKIVNQIEQLEHQIAEAQAVIDNSKQLKQA